MATPMRIINAGDLPNPLNSTLIVYSVPESCLKNSLSAGIFPSTLYTGTNSFIPSTRLISFRSGKKEQHSEMLFRFSHPR